mmetsp:Transcript_23980/g.61061  ORF Transcript_23980/g.61061 Transcript_23980/m.61061 type:complete len:262 (-) Transcript_23980:673-1458(-)
MLQRSRRICWPPASRQLPLTRPLPLTGQPLTSRASHHSARPSSCRTLNPGPACCHALTRPLLQRRPMRAPQPPPRSSASHGPPPRAAAALAQRRGRPLQHRGREAPDTADPQGRTWKGPQCAGARRHRAGNRTRARAPRGRGGPWGAARCWQPPSLQPWQPLLQRARRGHRRVPLMLQTMHRWLRDAAESRALEQRPGSGAHAPPQRPQLPPLPVTALPPAPQLLAPPLGQTASSTSLHGWPLQHQSNLQHHGRCPCVLPP